MSVAVDDGAAERRRLQRSLDDVGEMLSRAASWASEEPAEIARSLVEAVAGTLRLDLSYVLLQTRAGQPAELARAGESWSTSPDPAAIGSLVRRCLGANPSDWVRPVRCPPDLANLKLLPVRLGLAGELGALVAGSSQPDFPTQAETLILTVAANQATIALQEARRLGEAADRSRVEDVLRASETNFRRILETLPGLVHLMHADGKEQQFNGQLLDYFGMTSDELKAWERNGAVHPDDIGRLVDARARAIPAGLPYDVEHRCRRADGVYRWFHSRSRPVRDATGTITGWYSLMTDIDDLKRAEEELRRKEAFLADAQLLSATGSFSWRIDRDEIVWSDQLYRIFELDRSVRITLERVLDRIHPDDVGLFHNALEFANQTGAAFEIEHRISLPDGSVKHLHVLAHATRALDGSLEYLGAVQDITARRASEEALARSRAELARVARATSLGALTASIAHEVNQPLSGIITNASTCVRMLDADPPNVDGARETARRTIRDGHRASEVITRLRAFFTRKEQAIEPVDLNEATREVIVLSMPELRRGGITVREEVAVDLPPVSGDRVQLQQVILNLIMNAADAMSGIDDRPRELLVATASDDGRGVRLSVQDTGIGLDGPTSEKLFEAFYTTKTGGMGIGLSISRSIIERHGGRLWAAPNDGPGACFSFSIPSRIGH